MHTAGTKSEIVALKPIYFPITFLVMYLVIYLAYIVVTIFYTNTDIIIIFI